MSNESGYGKPPKKNQFQKGQSGNPRGRPRASERKGDESTLLLNIVRKDLLRPVCLTESGKRVRMPALKALIRRITHDALRGDAKAREQILKFLEKADLAVLNGQVIEPLHIIVTGGLPDD